VSQCVAVCRSVSQCLQCVAVCCSVLQCVAVCCSVSQCVAVFRERSLFRVSTHALLKCFKSPKKDLSILNILFHENFQKNFRENSQMSPLLSFSRVRSENSQYSRIFCVDIWGTKIYLRKKFKKIHELCTFIWLISWHVTGWRRDVECLIFAGLFLQKSHIIWESCAKRDLHFKTYYVPLFCWYFDMLQAGEETQDALSLQVSFRKRAVESEALQQKFTNCVPLFGCSTLQHTATHCNMLWDCDTSQADEEAQDALSLNCRSLSTKAPYNQRLFCKKKTCNSRYPMRRRHPFRSIVRWKFSNVSSMVIFLVTLQSFYTQSASLDQISIFTWYRFTVTL